MTLTWLETPVPVAELEALGMPPITRTYRATAKDGGTLIAHVVELQGRWGLNLIYEPKAAGLLLVTDHGTSDATPADTFRAPTYEELMDARWAFLPPDVMMVLAFHPEGHPEARLMERRNLVLHHMGNAQRGPIILQ